MNKKELRKKFLHHRNTLMFGEVTYNSRKIITKLMDTSWYEEAKVIMTYIDFRNEVMTREFIDLAIKDGKKIVIPITDVSSKTLILSELHDMDELCKGSYSILEPKKEYIRITDVNVLNLILVPGAVFDVRGYRIGYGGGYYDRLLEKISQNTKTIGLAFDFQIIKRVPNDNFDKKVDRIITEKRVIHYEYGR